jgi:hypothetical protein
VRFTVGQYGVAADVREYHVADSPAMDAARTSVKMREAETMGK